MPIILVVDDSETERQLIGGLLKCKLDWIVQYAKDGSEACDLVGQVFPDLIITDLQMPIMDGIELCKRVKLEHCHIPIILTTGVGSEALAVDALKAGAASYVPKSSLAKSLVETVEQVLAVSRRQRLKQCLLGHAVECRFRFELENDQALIDSTLNFLTMEMEALGIGNGAQRRQIYIALEEAMLNALFHGNLELNADQVREARHAYHTDQVSPAVVERSESDSYADRRIFVTMELSKEKVTMLVADQGQGFDTETTLAAAGKLEQLSGAAGSGRGLTLIKSFADELEFGKAGNQIRMVLNLDVPAAEKVADAVAT